MLNPDKRILAALALALATLVGLPPSPGAAARSTADLELHEENGASLLRTASLAFEAGDYATAFAACKHSLRDKEFCRGPYGDDAAFAEIMALEALGSGEDAAQDWSQWQDDHEDSPLQPAARLREAWNALGRGETAAAREILDRLASDQPWQTESPRFRVALAAVLHEGGDPAAALALLSGESTLAAGIYLRGLCHRAVGRDYAAARNFNELALRFPASLLAPYALLAKANLFASEEDYAAAAESFAALAGQTRRADIRREAELLAAACSFEADASDASIAAARQVARDHSGTDIVARAHFLVGEMLWEQARYDEAAIAFNRVLSDCYTDELAGRALYRIARCLDAQGRHEEANGSYQAVATGYPYSPEAPAAFYLAGVGLLEQGNPQAAAPYFQVVLDRYSPEAVEGMFAFSSPEHQELVEASLCLLEYSYHRMGNTGQLCGAPHLLLQKMPPSDSRWRAFALLIDADALAAESRYSEAQATLATLFAEFPDHAVGIKANRLLAWTYARQGRRDLAMDTEARLLARYSAQDDAANMSAAMLSQAHALFNEKRYDEAAAIYGEFGERFPTHADRDLAQFQAGLCALRQGRLGDAVDRWEAITARSPDSPVAARAWLRAGDLYFQTGHLDEARRCFAGLGEHFDDDENQARSLLRLAQCDYNAVADPEALAGFARVRERFPDTEFAAAAATGMAQTLYRLGLADPSGGYLQELVNTFPASPLAPEAQFALGMHHYESGEFPAAAAAFKLATTRYPDSDNADRAYYMMADSRLRAGEKDEARRCLEQFLAYFPGSEFDASARFRLATMLFEGGEYQGAVEQFTRVLEGEADEKTRSASLYNLALSQRLLGRNDEAARLLREYDDLGLDTGRSTDIARLVGEIHEEKGEFAAAAVRYENVLARNPDAAQAAELNYRLGFCRESLGEPDRAIRAYKQAIAVEKKNDPYRLSALARYAALRERQGSYQGALSAYQDLIRYAEDPGLVLAAKERASQLEASIE